jgi:hypothetical protein
MRYVSVTALHRTAERTVRDQRIRQQGLLGCGVAKARDALHRPRNSSVLATTLTLSFRT